MTCFLISATPLIEICSGRFRSNPDIGSFATTATFQFAAINESRAITRADVDDTVFEPLHFKM
jgi:hypothetical protein